MDKTRRRKHRVVLEITMAHECGLIEVMNALTSALEQGTFVAWGIDKVRPLDYRKTLTRVAGYDKQYLIDNIEAAIDTLRDARTQLLRTEPRP